MSNVVMVYKCISLAVIILFFNLYFFKCSSSNCHTTEVIAHVRSTCREPLFQESTSLYPLLLKKNIFALFPMENTNKNLWVTVKSWYLKVAWKYFRMDACFVHTIKQYFPTSSSLLQIKMKNNTTGVKNPSKPDVYRIISSIYISEGRKWIKPNNNHKNKPNSRLYSKFFCDNTDASIYYKLQ